MKIFVFIIAVYITRSCLQAVEETAKPEINNIKDTCVSESGVTTDVADEILSTFKAVRTSKIDCFISCLYINVELMTRDGKLIDKALRERLSANNISEVEINKVSDKCKNITGKDVCDSAGNLFDCLNLFKL